MPFCDRVAAGRRRVPFGRLIPNLKAAHRLRELEAADDRPLRVNQELLQAPEDVVDLVDPL
jgi:hypothetical protein